MMKCFVFVITAAMIPLCAHSEDCTVYQSQISNIEGKYKPIYEDYQKTGNQIKGEATAEFEVTWADTTIQFGTPTVTIKDQKITLGVPQVTMKMQEIIFDTPSVVMVPTKTGQYPEFTCDHAVIPSCTVKWSDIITNLPKTFMQRQNVKTLIPEFNFADTSFVMGIPEFSIQQQKFIIGLPQFKLKEAHLNASKMKKQSEELTSSISSTKSQQIKEVSSDTSQLFTCLRTDLNAQKAKASAAFEDGINKLNASITYIKTIGADPTNVVGSDGTAVNLPQQLSELIKKREAAFTQFDAGMKKLEDSEKTTLDQMAKDV
ncbi:hypothetical protein [Methylobacterium sp. E-066]|uniref:hypothetical protein n=1 Tax=Methylobacterium sp. E-066 TaxID=2836584 RepID=UPI001FBAD66B|nr:hypothetical protein [Methylobacterium sp. E-066]MCJ2144504.1 hypothetical protein [Methylobacterium sp. E-066]